MRLYILLFASLIGCTGDITSTGTPTCVCEPTACPTVDGGVVTAPDLVSGADALPVTSIDMTPDGSSNPTPPDMTPPNLLTLRAACATTGGQYNFGVCWREGNVGEACDDVCSSYGGLDALHSAHDGCGIATMAFAATATTSSNGTPFEVITNGKCTTADGNQLPHGTLLPPTNGRFVCGCRE
jgi:hypothetical protein